MPPRGRPRNPAQLSPCSSDTSRARNTRLLRRDPRVSWLDERFDECSQWSVLCHSAAARRRPRLKPLKMAVRCASGRVPGILASLPAGGAASFPAAGLMEPKMRGSAGSAMLKKLRRRSVRVSRSRVLIGCNGLAVTGGKAKESSGVHAQQSRAISPARCARTVQVCAG